MAMLFASVVATACVDDNIDYGDDDSNEVENIGYLSLSGLNISVLSDTEVITGTGNPEATRAEINTDNFNVEFLQNAGIME